MASSLGKIENVGQGIQNVESYPGMTRRVAGPADHWKPNQSLTELKPMLQRKIVLLATASITDSNIFNNGLYQNIFLLYRMAEILGYMPIFVVNSKPKNLEEVPEILRSTRIATVEELIKQPIPIHIYVEIGMSVEAQFKKFLKHCGARTAKLYLGNILNIDVETPMFFPHMYFAHHVVGETQEIWTSPHYGQHAEYAAALNHVEPGSDKQRIAPYIWDSCIMNDDGRRYLSWRPRKGDEKPTVLIMEPNISFQKGSLVPIMIVEELIRSNPHLEIHVMVGNGEKLLLNPHFRDNILPGLELYKRGHLALLGRKEVTQVMRSVPHAIGLLHHVNNEFNYMTLEYMAAGFPAVHNAACWKDFGYYYDGCDTRGGAQMLGEAILRHHERFMAYKAQGELVAWRHSLYNPEVQAAWKALYDGTPMPHEGKEGKA
jgi:hypothetical protein